MSEIAATAARPTSATISSTPPFKIAQTDAQTVLDRIRGVLGQPGGTLQTEVRGDRVGNGYVMKQSFIYVPPGQKVGDDSVTIDVWQQPNGQFTGSVTLEFAGDRGRSTLTYAPPPGSPVYRGSQNPADFAQFLVRQLASGNNRDFLPYPGY